MRTFVIDTGFDAQVAERRGRKMLLSPDIGLQRLGVTAAQVREVIITHLHYDHVGNFALFP
ncbi:MAG: MBL fold metallo-hydrolase, partial [Betaproteobacteria bacterium]